MKTITFYPTFIRRFPDPYNKIYNGEKHNIEHIITICNVKNIPHEIPKDPNPRSQNIDRAIYRTVKESLLNAADQTFLLKNKGITIIADDVIISEDKKEIKVIFSESDIIPNGIVDGAHTYEIIKHNQEFAPDNQYVKLEIITGLPSYLIEPIAEGLNTAVQVQQMSLSNLEGKFEWIKETLENEPYFNQIVFKENENGKFDARDIVALMTLFNIDLYPEMSNDHPKIAYTSKAKCLSDFIDNVKYETFKKIRPLLADILQLYDYVNIKSIDLYNKKYKGKAGALAFYKTKKRGTFSFLFSGKEFDFKLYDGALYPIMASMRFLVEQKPSSTEFSWKLDSFNDVLKFYDKVGGELIKISKITSDGKGRNPNAIGKDDNHWAYLYQTVAFEFMRSISDK